MDGVAARSSDRSTSRSRSDAAEMAEMAEMASERGDGESPLDKSEGEVEDGWRGKG